MNKKKVLNPLEYLSLAMILSYIIFHNILLVLIGILISLCLVNINFIDSLIKLLSEIYQKNQIKRSESTKFKANMMNLDVEDSGLTLAETIEELGFIPSKGKSIDNE
tara:strand:- start:745 stop:1065 length:321 start_codon:yes stop_codon:yes gene_type:complete